MSESKADAIPSHSDVVITSFAMLVALLACPALKAPNVHLCARSALLAVLLASFMAPLQSTISCVAMHSNPNKMLCRDDCDLCIPTYCGRCCCCNS